FEIFGRGPRVPDVWIGQSDDLSRVRRIGENFLITGQRGIENDFASSVALGADRLAAEDRSIFQSQNRGYRHADTPLESLQTRRKMFKGLVALRAERTCTKREEFLR